MCSWCTASEREQCVVKQTLRRSEVLSFFAQLEACLIGMEAGSGAHYWARELIELGRDARIMDPRLVAPYRNQGRTGKNEANDAEAICEAVSRLHMRFVPIKDPEQQAILRVHRVRKGIVNEQNRQDHQTWRHVSTDPVDPRQTFRVDACASARRSKEPVGNSTAR
jgi:transposase